MSINLTHTNQFARTKSDVESGMNMIMQSFIKLHDMNIRQADKFPVGNKWNLYFLEQAKQNKKDFVSFVNSLSNGTREEDD